MRKGQQKTAIAGYLGESHMRMQRWVGRSFLLAGLLAGTPLLVAQRPGAAPTPEGTQSPAATPDELLRQATEAIDSGHLPESRLLLDRVRTLDATHRGLWAAYAVLSLREKAPETAVDEFSKELALHPDQLPVYGALASVLVELKRRPDALAVLQRWQAAAPNDPRPAVSVVTFLLAEDRAEDAVRAGHEALARLPETARGDLPLGYALGSAELKAGDKAAGAKRLVGLLGMTNDSSTRNSIAYELADANVELPTAEAVERGVLGQIELESEGWNANAGPQPLQFGTPLLAAAWDTLGWILFREGKPADAEPLVRASWRNELRGAIGEHLSEIEAARGQAAAAHADLQLAVAAARAVDEGGGAAQAALAAMEARLGSMDAHAAAQPGKGVTAPGAATVLERLRTFSLGPAGGRSGSALYAVLISRGRIVGSVPGTPGGTPWGEVKTLLAHADLAVLFPAPGAYVQLVHLARVNCAPRGCELVLQP